MWLRMTPRLVIITGREMLHHKTLFVSSTSHHNIGQPISRDMAIDSATPTSGLLMLGCRQYNLITQVPIQLLGAATGLVFLLLKCRVIRVGTLGSGRKVDSNILTSGQPDSGDVQVLIKCYAEHPHPMMHSRTHKSEGEPTTFRQWTYMIMMLSRLQRQMRCRPRLKSQGRHIVSGAGYWISFAVEEENFEPSMPLIDDPMDYDDDAAEDVS
ncbi:hypothetical protein E2562_011988 [Oryza meyeriana var. granulata]|uniref:Uncharacterized protein n=1 Tax=Oryza meyeriana var. granulata TaxID=110450 RepID=A0A6G1F767_9ORYZ|nr:hypothetical protein E2562_011988 [Oryza meyeriana var. granulata]